MESISNNIEELEERLDAHFKDKKVLETALTHSSYANGKKFVKFNERLEFLGDAVLQLAISKYLFLNYRDEQEGVLTKKRSLIVCETSLYEVAKKWNIGKYIKMSKGEEMTGGRERMSILADCVEAIIAAFYIDNGYKKVDEFIIKNFQDIIEKAVKDEIVFDYKTRLQEILQQNGEVDIDYELVKFEGPPHRRKFYTQVAVDSNILASGVGYSKKQSEQDAAYRALANIKSNDRHF
ncbi:MAG: ribonuclease III [Clostridium sp.]|jgi:ribonuclease-3|uniref:ribonuclease III n=1 Tax=Clostridium sp. TaxID=1506 RepID=UPI0025BFA74E|nr:ribonuclease III [Clostridium sp.]MCH3964016.1 ribonuclease III [Clostridium sp.]MCI1716217.1 ribonuclease III [Clostridium sp.]MCI1800543.1 ribonuclease III [Clostridium sp.]MCI1814394.1 ribonuclease III [Clostridium sp.]MCI1871293.1 ribonuclease III [Clostridium sp.]